LSLIYKTTKVTVSAPGIPSGTNRAAQARLSKRRHDMKTLLIAAVAALSLTAAPALAGGHSSGKSGLAVGLGLGVVTGKSGLLGSLLGGGHGHGSQTVIAVNAGASVKTGKSGLLGLLGGSGSSRHGGGYGHGGW
jgi:hypothetical protein